MKSVIALAACLAITPSFANADSNTANDRMAGCRALAETTNVSPRGSPKDEFEQALCLGQIVGLLELGPLLDKDFRFCKPEGATPEQALRVVLKAIDSMPEYSHLNFMWIANRSLVAAWPCKN